MASSTGLPNQVVETYCRQEKRARIAGNPIDPKAPLGIPVEVLHPRDWADLIAGPAGLIAERVLADDVADYLRFRGVCRTWRQCTASPHAYGSLDRRFHPRRWIMLPQTMGDVRKRRTFMNVSTGERLKVSLPELCYQHVFGTTSDGLIVLCDRRSYVIRLLNPLTRQLTGLPDATTLQYTASSQQRTSGYTLKFLQPGDKQWTRLHHIWDNMIIATLPFAGRFYCVTEKAIMALDTSQRQPRLAVAAGLGDLGSTNMRYDRTIKLVDNGGELVLARQVPFDSKNPIRGGYEAHRVDLEAGITMPMQQGFGGRALFCGDAASPSATCSHAAAPEPL
ncbi:hypothetical protein VPH35_023756 [Triticum aestivum]